MPRLFRSRSRFRRFSLTALEKRITPASFLVTSSSDSGPGTLRQALLDANVNSQADTISFAPGITVIDLTGGELVVNTDLAGLTIQGPGATGLVIRSVQSSGNPTNRILRLDIAGGSAPVTITGLTLADGFLSGNNSGAGLSIADELVTLDGVRFTGHRSVAAGAALAVTATGARLTISNCEFTNNSAGNIGGAIAVQATSTVTINDSLLSNNIGTRGGAISLAASVTHQVTINRSIITGNSAATAGGAAVYARGSGLLSINSSWITGNTSSSTTAGSIDTSLNTKIIGTTVAGNIGSGIGTNIIGQLLEVASSTIVDNSGAGIYRGNGSVTLNSSVVARNLLSLVPDDIHSGGFLSVEGDHNFIGAGTSTTLTYPGPNNKVGTRTAPLDPKLSSFMMSVGGVAPVYVPLAGSPLVNAGNNFAGLSTDLRGAGFPRIVGSGPDIGAIEGAHVAPHVTAVNLPPLLLAGGTTHRINVTITDDIGIDSATLDASDLTVIGPAGATAANFVGMRTTPSGLIVEYDVLAPGGTWDTADTGDYIVTLAANQVFDLDASPSAAPAIGLGTIRVDVGPILTVDAIGDVSDGKYGPGQLTLREAIAIANASTNVLETIRFASTIYGETIVLQSSLTVLDRVAVDGPGDGRITISNAGTAGLFAIDSPVDQRPSQLSGLTIYRASAPSGALITTNSDSLTFERMRFVENDLTSAAAIRMTGGAVSIIDSEFLHNRGTRSAVEADSAKVVIERTLFEGHKGTSALLVSGSSLRVYDSTFVNNQSTGSGGAITGSGSSVFVSNCTFLGNSASTTGGAIQSTFLLAKFTNNTIVANTAAGTGGGGVSLGSVANALMFFDGNLVAGNINPTHPDLYTLSTLPIYIQGNLFGAIGSASATFSGTSQYGTLASPIAAKLSSPGYYGGERPTVPPLAGSPALDLSIETRGLNFDARGPDFPRIVGPAADAGAVEGVFAGPRFASVAPITVTPGAASLFVDVTFAGTAAIDTSTIDAADVVLYSPWLVAPIGADSVTIIGSGTTVTARYEFPAPGGTWDRNDNHATYRLRLAGQQVKDIDGRAAPATPVATFGVHVPTTIVVDTLADTIDPNDGKTSLREALELSNTGSRSVNSLDTITFAPALNGGTITFTAGELVITDPVAIFGPGPGLLTINAVGKGRHFNLNSAGNGTTTISGLRLTSGTTIASGGSIYVGNDTAVVTNVVLESNSANASGGGIAVGKGGSLELSSSFLNANLARGSGTTTAGGGAIAGLGGAYIRVTQSQLMGNTSQLNGGGVVAIGSDTVSIESTSIVNNRTSGAATNSGGGGILINGGMLTLANSLLLGNTAFAKTSAYGGGLSISSGSVVQVRNSTIAWNSAAFAGAGVYFNSAASTVLIDSSLIANNVNTTHPDIASVAALAQPIQGNNNLIGVLNDSDVTWAGTYKAGTLTVPLDAKITNPNYYGGERVSVSPLPGSPAIDGGTNPMNFTTDARGPGFPRVTGAAVDIGAVESPLTYPYVVNVQLPDVTTVGFPTYLASVVFADDAGIDTASIDTGDVRLSGPGIIGEATPVNVSIANVAGGIRADYTFAAPDGGWTAKHNGQYSLRIVDGQVSDLDAVAKSISGWSLGGFRVSVAASYVVDSLGNLEDGLYGP
ncbi:MAG: right-handed parallel beta-helix repeat-containing protein, partial [Gemmataceae bacterium]|nr:right-handed parallel beta-helix repeat-containing protein [Gemmataceae bacterium]